MGNPRKAVSKRTRFAVFARDNFTCRYCGLQSDTVPLVVDHIIPVAAGGLSEMENLATACEPCNQGKAATTLEQHQPNETDRLRLAQERNEQMRSAEAAQQLVDARAAMERVVVEYWCDARGADDYDARELRLMTSWAMRYGANVVFEWIDIAAQTHRHSADYKMAKYISGIRRNWIRDGRIPGDV